MLDLPVPGGYIAAAYKVEDAIAKLIGSYMGQGYVYRVLDSDKKARL